MQIIEIVENDTIPLDDNDIKQILEIKRSYPSLPIDIISSRLVFKDYIIGEIQLQNKLIRILPRHEALNLSHFFEMLLYCHYSGNTNLSTLSYSQESKFGVLSLVDNFLLNCKELIKFGITGTFNSVMQSTFKPRGKIVVSQYIKNAIPITGIKVIEDQYDYDQPLNQIIKTALLKIQKIKNLSSSNKSIISNILINFENVGIFNNIDLLDLKIRSVTSTNPFYPIVLEYSSKILRDFKTGYSKENNDTNWSIFLENSNSTFENYIRKILSKELTNKVEKWNQPHNFAEISYNDHIGYKSFSPDIIIDYNLGTARAIFDVKNKDFSLKNTNISEIVSVADIYQLLFYSEQLKSNVCGLIYPTSSDYKPILVEIMSKDIKFFLISMNLNKNIDKRHKILIDDINYCLNYT